MRFNGTPYSRLVRQNSSHTYKFMKKLRYKKNESVHFILVHDAASNKRSYNSFPNGLTHKPTLLLHKPLKRLDKRIPQSKLYAYNNKSESVHLLTQNSNGYAVFMGINYGGTKDSDIKEIRAQFIDVDLNKISERFNTLEEVWQKIKALRANPTEKFQSITVKKNKQGEYLFSAHRPERQIQKLKKKFLYKHRRQIRNAMIVETYNGYHIYWIITGGAINKFVPIQKALVRKFNSDPAVTNLARVMRIPGFFHMKNPKSPFMVRVVRWGRKKPFSQEELINGLSLES